MSDPRRVTGHVVITRANDMAVMNGCVYADLKSALTAVSKRTGRPFESLSAAGVLLSRRGMPDAKVLRVDYPGYIGSGGERTEYYLTTPEQAGIVAVLLTRRQYGEATITPLAATGRPDSLELAERIEKVVADASRSGLAYHHHPVVNRAETPLHGQRTIFPDDVSAITRVERHGESDRYRLVLALDDVPWNAVHALMCTVNVFKVSDKVI